MSEQTYETPPSDLVLRRSFELPRTRRKRQAKWEQWRKDHWPPSGDSSEAGSEPAQTELTTPAGAEPKADVAPGLGHATAVEDVGSAAQVDHFTGQINEYIIQNDFSWLNASPNQEPSARYKTAIRFLDSGATARATELIKEAVNAGFKGDAEISANHIAYHWLLAILSGRSVNQLQAEDLAAITAARALANQASPDQWQAPYNLVSALLAIAERQIQGRQTDEASTRVLREFDNLQEPYRDHVRRHLHRLLAAAQADRRVADPMEEAVTGRMSGDRIGRAWKYFEPIPAAPRQRELAEPALPTGRVVVAAIGAGIGTAGAWLALAAISAGGVLRAVVLAGIVAISGITTALSHISFQARRTRVTARDREHGRPRPSRYALPVPAVGRSDLHEDSDEAGADGATSVRARRARFVESATAYIDARFQDNQPPSEAARERWRADTAGLRGSMLEEILDLYPEADARLGSANWLINFRVREIVERWLTGTLWKYRDELRPRPRAVLGLAGAVSTLAAAMAYALIVVIRFQSAPGLIGCALIVVAGLVVASSKLDVYLFQVHAMRGSYVETVRRFESDQKEYTRWEAVLRDRPDDMEFARWLDYDKTYLETLAISQLGLSSAEILAYATVTEPGPGRVGARLPYGPPRFSIYTVSVFLLTTSGLRQMTVNLNSCTGEIYNQVRRSIRHDVVASATVREQGIRFDSGIPQSVQLTDQSLRVAQPNVGQAEDGPRVLDASLILQKVIELRLTTGGTITFRLESFESDYGDVYLEDPASLLKIAFDTSGISSVVDLLAQITGDDTQWAAQIA